MKIVKIAMMNKNSNQRRIVYDIEHISPTLQAAMGISSGNVPRIIEENDEDK